MLQLRTLTTSHSPDGWTVIHIFPEPGRLPVLPSQHSMSQSPSSQTQPVMANLPRVLGASQATAIVVGTVIGSGIFLVPSEMMRITIPSVTMLAIGTQVVFGAFLLGFIEIE